jgi:PAS domain S-box-containing protein
MDGHPEASPERSSYRKLVPYGVLLICLCLTASVWLLSDHWSKRREQLRFQNRTANTVLAITERIQRDAVILRGCEALFAVSGHVTRNQWRTYVEHLAIQDVLPGIQGIGFAQYIKPSELDGHIRQIREEGFPDYTVRPGGERKEYTSVIFLEPFDARNQRAFGYDMFSEPVRRSAMGRARNTGTVAMSGKVSLIQETGEGVQAGFLIYLPVYRENAESGTSPAEGANGRRGALLGYVYTPIRINNLMRATFPSSPDDIAFQIYDGTEVSPATLLYDGTAGGGTHGDKIKPLFSSRRTVNLYGHPWTLVFRTLPSFKPGVERYLSEGILIAGIIISLLAFLLVREQENNRTRALALARDMTSALQESEKRFRKVFEQGPLGIAIVGLDYRWVAVNAAVCRMLGHTEAELSKLTFVDVTHPEDIDADVESAEKLARGEIPSYKMEKRYIKKSGEVLWINLTGSTIVDERGEALYYLSMIEDISERKRSEEALRESEQTQSTLVGENPESILLTDTNGIILTCSRVTAQRFNLPMHEIIGSCFYDLLPPEVAEERKRRVLEVIATGKPIRFEDVRFGRTIDNHFQPVLNAEGKVVKLVILGIDITELREAVELQKRLATAIEQSAEAVVITDAEGVIQYVNPATERITGYDKAEIIGKTPCMFESGEHGKSFFDDLWDTIRSGNTWSGRIVNKKKDGTLYQEDATISPVRDASGKITNFVSVKRDISENLELTKQLFQSQKMEAVGTLAGGIAHDFNNLLTVVLGYSEILLMDRDERDPVYADLRRINQAGQKGADLVQRILAFSRKSEVKLRPSNLNQQIVQLRKMLERTIPKMIEIELKLTDGLHPVNADPTQMDQVLMNLALNARDAMPDRGTLTIETANVTVDEEYARKHIGTEPGEYVLLSVSDTGCGMDGETVEHIFEPFFTTKEAGKGTGLGLAMVYGIVTQHGGQIRCYSEQGHGTTFKIYLPAIEPEEEAEEKQDRTAMPEGGTETILLVDDEKPVRDLGKRILESSGYTVMTAVDGAQALEVFKKERSRISLVILDLIMPEMGGAQCLQELLSIDPKTKVLIASGFAATGQPKEPLDKGAVGFVAKPYNVREMRRTVRDILDSE